MADAAPEREKIPDQIKAAALLLPGFVTERVSEYYRTGPKMADVEIVASALAFTLLNALLAFGIMTVWYRCRSVRPSELLGYRSFWGLVFVISVVVGAAWAFLDSRDLVFRYLPVTSRASRASVWHKVFQENRYAWHNFIKVTTTDGRVYHGNPKYFAEGGDDEGVFVSPAFLEKAALVRGRSAITTCRQVPGSGVLIPKGSVASIEFRTLPERADYPCPGVH